MGTAFVEFEKEPTLPVEDVPQGYRYVQIDQAVEKRTVRKLDFNIMPLVVAICKFTLIAGFRVCP